MKHLIRFVFSLAAVVARGTAASAQVTTGSLTGKVQNEALAATLAETGPQHRGLATVPLQDPKLAAEELRFAVLSLGLCGAMIDPNALGRALGDPGFDPFWGAAADLEAPVILHPYALEAVERFGRHYLHNLVGYPFETTLAAGSLALRPRKAANTAAASVEPRMLPRSSASVQLKPRSSTAAAPMMRAEMMTPKVASTMAGPATRRM